MANDCPLTIGYARPKNVSDLVGRNRLVARKVAHYKLKNGVYLALIPFYVPNLNPMFM
jgi:hypothetical protein